MKQPCWKCGATGKNFNPDVTAIEPCSVCGGTGYLDDAVYHLDEVFPPKRPTTKKLELLVEYVEMLMKWFRKGEKAVMNPIVHDLERIADEYEALKEASDE